MMAFLRATVCTAFLSLFFVYPAWGEGEIFTVKSRQTQARQHPSFTSSVTGALAYGDHAEAVAERGGWLQVKSGGTMKGWVHLSALTAGYTDLKPGRKAAAASDGHEVSRAGKGLSLGEVLEGPQTIGFDQSVEDRYRKGSPGGYGHVNAMSRASNGPKSLLDFLAVGGVTPATGDAQ